MSLLKVTRDFLQSFVENKDNQDALIREQWQGASVSELRELDEDYNTRYMNKFKARSEMEIPKKVEWETCPQCKNKRPTKTTCHYCDGKGVVEKLTL